MKYEYRFISLTDGDWEEASIQGADFSPGYEFMECETSGKVLTAFSAQGWEVDKYFLDDDEGLMVVLKRPLSRQ